MIYIALHIQLLRLARLALLLMLPEDVVTIAPVVPVGLLSTFENLMLAAPSLGRVSIADLEVQGELDALYKNALCLDIDSMFTPLSSLGLLWKPPVDFAGWTLADLEATL